MGCDRVDDVSRLWAFPKISAELGGSGFTRVTIRQSAEERKKMRKRKKSLVGYILWKIRTQGDVRIMPVYKRKKDYPFSETVKVRITIEEI